MSQEKMELFCLRIEKTLSMILSQSYGNKYVSRKKGQGWKAKVRVGGSRLGLEGQGQDGKVAYICGGSRLGLESQGYGWRAKVRDAVPRLGLEGQGQDEEALYT